MFPRQILRDGDHLREQCGVPFSEFHDIRVFLGLGHDEQVDRGTRRDIAKRDDAFRLENDVGGNLAGDDGGKDAHCF
jgi:hypothetical protein